MKYTIVTVCYNAEKTIRQTIESVLNQTYENIEYLIIDGASDDNTLKIINEYTGDERLSLVSEPDTGLYNAMNKGIRLATGEYINFMNSGDRFADEKVLEDMSPFMKEDIVYGDVIREYPYGTKIEKQYSFICTIMRLSIGRMMSHQSVFTRTDILKNEGFNENYSICADYEFITRSVHNKNTFRHVKRIVAHVNCYDGISQQSSNLNEMRYEDDKCLKEYMPGWYYATRIPRLILRKVREKTIK